MLGTALRLVVVCGCRCALRTCCEVGVLRERAPAGHGIAVGGLRLRARAVHGMQSEWVARTGVRRERLAVRAFCGYGCVLDTACGAGGLQVRSRAAHSCGVRRRVARAGLVGNVAIGQPAVAWRLLEGAIRVDLNKMYGAAVGGMGPY